MNIIEKLKSLSLHHISVEEPLNQEIYDIIHAPDTIMCQEAPDKLKITFFIYAPTLEKDNTFTYPNWHNHYAKRFFHMFKTDVVFIKHYIIEDVIQNNPAIAQNEEAMEFLSKERKKPNLYYSPVPDFLKNFDIIK